MTCAVHLAHILLEQAQTKSLVQSNLASMPDLLQLTVMGKYLQFNNSNDHNVTNISVDLAVHTTSLTATSYSRQQLIAITHYAIKNLHIISHHKTIWIRFELTTISLHSLICGDVLFVEVIPGWCNSRS